MTRNNLRIMLAATVAAVSLAGNAWASGAPSASDFQLVETGNGFGGVYSVSNLSTDWYITAFAVTNSNAGQFNASASTSQFNWAAGRYCNGSGCGNTPIGTVESSPFAGNPDIANGLGDGYGFYYYNDALEDDDLSLLLSTSLGPGTSNNSNFQFHFARVESTVQFSLVNGDGVGATVVVSPTSAVPEPASWALMIGGFGLAGVALRRRRAVAA